MQLRGEYGCTVKSESSVKHVDHGPMDHVMDLFTESCDLLHHRFNDRDLDDSGDSGAQRFYISLRYPLSR